MTDEEVVAELLRDSKLNRARRVYAASIARLEHAMMQRRRPGPIEMRRMEFEIVKQIAEVLEAKL